MAFAMPLLLWIVWLGAGLHLLVRGRHRAASLWFWASTCVVMLAGLVLLDGVGDATTGFHAAPWLALGAAVALLVGWGLATERLPFLAVARAIAVVLIALWAVQVVRAWPRLSEPRWPALAGFLLGPMLAHALLLVAVIRHRRHLDRGQDPTAGVFD